MSAPTATTPSTDRIDKQFHVKAARSRVWRAIADAGEFGSWFGIDLDRAFTPGATVRGRIRNPEYAHIKVEMLVEAIEPETYFAYRWHPYANDPATDYSTEPMTLVEFRLDETAAGTTVSISESGFDRLPASRRAEAFRMNEGGWAGQSKSLTRYVEQK